MTTANYVFCIEFQDRKLMLNHVRRQNGGRPVIGHPYMMSTLLVMTSAS